MKKAETYATGDDEWKVVGKDMHIRYADGAGKMQMKGDHRASAGPRRARHGPQPQHRSRSSIDWLEPEQ